MRLVAARPALIAVALAGALSATEWPTFTLVVAILCVSAVLAWRRPAYAMALALGLWGFEGTLKVRFTAEGTPLSQSANVVGAAALDLALAIAVAGVVRVDRGKSVVRIWRAGRAPKIFLSLIGGWIVLSVVQIAFSPSVVGALEGFRLTQAYLFAAVGGAGMASLLPPSRIAALLVLATFPAAAYGALRGWIGPSSLERSLAAARQTTAFIYPPSGPIFRNVGSFSSATGLASYLVPSATLAALLALPLPRLRVPSVAVFVLSMFAISTSYVRTGLIAVAAALVVAVPLLMRLRDSTVSARAAALVAVAVVALGGVAVTAATALSPAAADRTRAVLSPFADQSMRDRFRNWRHQVAEIRGDPSGSGLGTVGRASGGRSGVVGVTTDNSYLKVFREQGVAGGTLFILGLVGLVLLALWRSATGAGDPLLLASAGAVLAFLILAVNGEFVEQPGKALAWALLGVALSRAYASTPSTTSRNRRTLVASSNFSRTSARP